MCSAFSPSEADAGSAALLRRSVAFDIAPGVRLLAGDVVTYGRTAHGERFSQGLLHERCRVRRAGRLVWAGALDLNGNITAILPATAGFAGAVPGATVLYVAGDAFEHLDAARVFASLCGAEDGGGRAGVTLVGGVLLARFIGPDGQALRRRVAGYEGRLRAAAAGLPERLPLPTRLWHV